MCRSLFIATWSLSESPLTIRNAVSPLLTLFGHHLVVFQDSFYEVENFGWFHRVFMTTMKANIWWHEPIPKFQYNSWLFGKQSPPVKHISSDGHPGNGTVAELDDDQTLSETDFFKPLPLLILCKKGYSFALPVLKVSFFLVSREGPGGISHIPLPRTLSCQQGVEFSCSAVWRTTPISIHSRIKNGVGRIGAE